LTTDAARLLDAFQSYLACFDEASLHGFQHEIDWAMEERPLQPALLDCLRHLDVMAENTPARSRALVDLLAARRNDFHWSQTYTPADFGQEFVDNYGWLEVFGTRGHFANDRVAAGVLILGPGIDYPDHHHVAEEIYIPLSGTALWRKGEGDYRPRAPGDVIHHPSNVNHAMRTGKEPLLALYLWRGGPLAQRSVIAGRPQTREA
jgi:quercetin dioxygenase-like cupin family protein